MTTIQRRVWYHANCWDGLGAAWAAHLAWEDNFGGDTAVYVPVFYGQDLPGYNPGDEIYILDFSFPRAKLEELAKTTRLLVIDHHKTALEDLAGLPNCIFDMNRSGAMLAWEHFFGRKPPPLGIIHYIEDRDLWRFKLEHAQEIIACLRSYPLEFATLDKFKLAQWPEYISEGKAILRAHNQLVEAMANGSRFIYLGGVWMPCVNASVLFSEVGAELMRKYNYDCAAYYFDRGDGKRQWGLRSRAPFDCSQIAKKYGGGGHAQAAGFETDPSFVGE